MFPGPDNQNFRFSGFKIRLLNATFRGPNILPLQAVVHALHDVAYCALLWAQKIDPVQDLRAFPHQVESLNQLVTEIENLSNLLIEPNLTGLLDKTIVLVFGLVILYTPVSRGAAEVFSILVAQPQMRKAVDISDRCGTVSQDFTASTLVGDKNIGIFFWRRDFA